MSPAAKARVRTRRRRSGAGCEVRVVNLVNPKPSTLTLNPNPKPSTCSCIYSGPSDLLSSLRSEEPRLQRSKHSISSQSLEIRSYAEELIKGLGFRV